MIAVADKTAFTEWLQAEMDARTPRVNKRQLAAAIGSSPSTVGAWFTLGWMPSPDFCRRLAEYFHRPVEDVLRAAGHLPPVALPPSEDTDLMQDPRFRTLAEVWTSLHPRAQEIVLNQALALRGLRPTDPTQEPEPGQ